jgi:hypothetical protein
MICKQFTSKTQLPANKKKTSELLKTQFALVAICCSNLANQHCNIA